MSKWSLDGHFTSALRKQGFKPQQVLSRLDRGRKTFGVIGRLPDIDERPE
jgi:hypothetical protein